MIEFFNRRDFYYQRFFLLVSMKFSGIKLNILNNQFQVLFHHKFIYILKTLPTIPQNATKDLFVV